jgi:hypothetical protein
VASPGLKLSGAKRHNTSVQDVQDVQKQKSSRDEGEAQQSLAADGAIAFFLK